MLINVLDAQGVAQKMVVQGQEAIVDHSGSIAATGTSQTAIAANSLRSGCIIQNVGANPMFINELGVAAASTGGSFTLAPGATFPPAGMGLSAAAINITGTVGDKFTAREW